MYAKFMPFMSNLCSLYARYATNMLYMQQLLACPICNKYAKTKVPMHADHRENMQTICSICIKYAKNRPESPYMQNMLKNATYMLKICMKYAKYK